MEAMFKWNEEHIASPDVTSPLKKTRNRVDRNFLSLQRLEAVKECTEEF
jgi:hypothetical protein